MMYGKSLTLYCILPIIASSSVLWSNFTSDNEEKDYSTTVRYQLDANTMKNYDDGEDWYNLHENFTKNNDDMQYVYRINFTNNNHERLMIDHFIQYKSRAHENDSQISVNSRINSTEFDDKENFTLQEDYDSKWMKSNINFTYDLPKYFNRNNSKNNVIPYKSEMCDDFTCIRLCCPLGNRLIDGNCIPDQGYFVFLRSMYGYINDSFQSENDKVNDPFLLVVHDPCQKTEHYLHNPYSNTFFLANGSLYLSYYNTIVESTSYCLAVIDHYIFAVKVCFETTKKIISKITNKNASYTNENLKNTENKSESVWHEYSENISIDNNKNNHSTIITTKNIIPYKMCDNITCFRLCCPFGKQLIKGTCKAQKGDFIFLRNMYGYINNSLQSESKGVDEVFLLVIHDPCQKTGHYSFKPTYNTFFADGSLYLSDYNTTIESTSYCLASVAHKFTVNVCLDIMKKIMKKTINYNKIENANNLIITHNIENETHNRKNDSHIAITQDSIMRNIVFFCGKLGVMLSSLMMFLVYFIMPELRNIYGFILCRYSGLVFVAYTVELLNTLIETDALGNSIYIIFAFVKYYAFFGSYFWLNVMSFNFWRTFRQLHSSQGMMKQEEKKMLIIYSIYAWGIPFMIIIIYSILHFVPVIPNNFRLKFSDKCLIIGRLPYWLYYYGIIIISVTSNICLSFFTARKISYFEKNVAHHLRNSEKQCYNDQKQWFKLQLEVTKVLFIIICIQTCININVLYNNNDTLYAIRYMLFALDVIQYFCVFIIFVRKKKIRQLFLKRLGCQSHGIFSATQHAISSSNNRNATSTMTRL